MCSSGYWEASRPTGCGVRISRNLTPAPGDNDKCDDHSGVKQQIAISALRPALLLQPNPPDIDVHGRVPAQAPVMPSISVSGSTAAIVIEVPALITDKYRS